MKDIALFYPYRVDGFVFVILSSFSHQYPMGFAFPMPLFPFILRSFIRTGLYGVLLFLPLLLQAQDEDPRLDSLRSELEGNAKGKERIELHLAISERYIQLRQFDRSRKQAERAIDELQDRAPSRSLARAHYIKAKSHHLQASYYRAQRGYEKALGILEEIEVGDGLKASISNNLGILHRKKGRYDSALTYYMRSLEIKKELGKDPQALAGSYVNIGGVHYKIGAYREALSYFKKGLKKYREAGDSSRVVDVVNNIGTVLTDLGKHARALEKFRKALRSEKGEQGKRAANTYNNIGRLYEDLQKADSLSDRSARLKRRISEKGAGSLLDSAIFYRRKALKIERAIDDLYGLTHTLIGLGKIASRKGDHQKALRHLHRSAEIADSLGIRPRYYRAQRQLSLTYAESGRYKKAFEHHREYSRVGDSIHTAQSQKKIAEMREKYEAEKKRRRIQELEKEKALSKARERRQWAIIYAAGSGLLIVLVLLYYIWTRLKLIRSQRDLIEEKKEEADRAFTKLREAHEDLQEKNREIGDSIQYASLIQEAILPSRPERERMLGEHALVFKPQATVSGDFYWCYESGGLCSWAAVDCTGHGVPGAFMSMIGTNLLDQAVMEKKETDPGRILDELRKGVAQKFGDRKRRDGMDAALCTLFEKNGKKLLRFAGANNPLYLIRKGVGSDPPQIRTYREGEPTEVQEERIRPFRTGNDGLALKGDKQVVGYEEKEKAPFTSLEFEVQEGDLLYVFSDGFADQFGGPNGKKFRYRSFQELLLEVSDRPLEEQSELLEKRFEEWRGDHEQVDDVLVLGVRI